MLLDESGGHSAAELHSTPEGATRDGGGGGGRSVGAFGLLTPETAPCGGRPPTTTARAAP